MEGPGKGGKRKPIVRGGFDTAKEAQQALDEARARLKHGIVVNDRLTVGRYLDEWLAAKGDIRPSTLRGYQQHIKKYLRPGLGPPASGRGSACARRRVPGRGDQQ